MEERGGHRKRACCFWRDFLLRQVSGYREHRKHHEKPSKQHVKCDRHVVPERVRAQPANAEPLFAAPDVYAYRICERPCGPGFVIPAFPSAVTDPTAVKLKISSEKIRTASIAIFTSYASIFFPRYSGVLPTISPALNT